MSGVVALACLGLMDHLAMAEDSADPVYRRYKKEVVPSVFTEEQASKLHALPAVATQKDVDAGRAVFTLEGLGEVRQWKLPRCPGYAVWTTLKQFPVQTDNGPSSYEISGQVIQAEELMVDGKWRRYLGLVTPHGVAVAPAEEVDLSLDDAPVFLPVGETEEISWQHLPGGLDWGVSAPKRSNEKPGKADPFAAADPLPVTVWIRNRRSAPRIQPTDLYRSDGEGGPALCKGVTLHMERAPFNARTPDSDYPGDQDYVPLVPRHAGAYVPEDKGQLLETGKVVKSFTLDLRDWFDLGKEGYYRFGFDFDKAVMGLPVEPLWGATFVRFGFNVGTPPERVSLTELNREIPPLGDKGAEQRILKLIDETCKAPAKQVGGGEPVWSEPVAGLATRVVDFDWSPYGGTVVLVGLKNVSAKPMVVPLAHPALPPPSGLFEVQTRTGETEWQTVKSFRSPDKLDLIAPIDGGRRSGKEHSPPPRTATLEPGQEAVVYLSGSGDSMTTATTAVRVIFRQTPESGWQGTVITPAVPVDREDDAPSAMPGQLKFPARFPDLSPNGADSINGPGNVPEVSRLHLANCTLLNSLAFYQPDGVRVEFERRMAAEKNMPMKLLLATVATWHGSQPAAMHLLEMMKVTDYDTVVNVHRALRMLASQSDGPPQPWLLEMLKAALSDERHVTGLKNTRWATGTHFTIDYLADEDADLALVLGHWKCREAVPFLLDQVRAKPSRMRIMALGAIGDERAIPVLIDIVTAHGKEAEQKKGIGLSPEIFSRAIEALGNLKAAAAVPVLLEYRRFPEVIEVLERIADRRALPAFRELASNEGQLLKDGKEVDPDLAKERLVKVKIALASLEEGDAIPRLCALLGDKSFGEFDRREVVWRLGNRPDPRAVPFLVNAIKTDPSGSVVNQAITVLAEFKFKVAVEGLIGCFDANFAGKNDWKRAYEPEMFQKNIASSLRKITGRKFGAERKPWQEWWQKEGPTVEGLTK